MSSITEELAGTSIALIIIISIAAGYIKNILWTFHVLTTREVLLGIMGIILAPIGAIHGIYLFFVH